jgi:hypothetical protein
MLAFSPKVIFYRSMMRRAADLRKPQTDTPQTPLVSVRGQP